MFACYDTSCRPPTSGGTGGSSKKLGPKPVFQPRGAGESHASYDARIDKHLTEIEKWTQATNQKRRDSGGKATTIDKWQAAGNLGETNKVVMGRKPAQKDDPTPPVAYGAKKWVKGDDGVWESKALVGQAKKKYAIKGEKSGEWIVAHILNSKSLPTRDEIVGMMRQADTLQAKWPLTHRPELVIGDFTAKKVTGRGTAGFTYSGTIQGAKRELIMVGGFNVNSHDIPVGNHVIFINSNPANIINNTLKASAGFLSPAYVNTNGWDYTVAHEYGHLRNWQGADKNVFYTVGDVIQKVGPPISRYGKSSRVEAHAEGFAEWVHSGGRTIDAFSRELAKTYDWPT